MCEWCSEACFWIMDQLIGIHLEVLNRISVFSFYNVNMRKEHAEKYID